MKNLEIKLRINGTPATLSPYFKEVLHQTDTYYSYNNGRLKLREERGKTPYFVSYNRPDEKNEVLSEYHIFPVEDKNLFFRTFGGLFQEELKVIKKRKLYMIENTRIHIDTVNELGNFMEIEVVIRTEQQRKNANNLLQHILQLTGTENNERISVGYRELLINKLREKKKIPQYYFKNPKCFWVVNKNIKNEFKANEIVPCLFTELKDGKHNILQLDMSLENDHNKYTMWRKMIGQHYNIYCSVLLIKDDKLFDLDGIMINTDSLGWSDVYVHKSYLAKFDTL